VNEPGLVAATQALSPLVVDLDGTLTPTDTLFETAVRCVKRHPFETLLWPLWLMQGRAAFKARLIQRSGWAGQNIPLREDLLEYLAQQRAQGRRLVLATAADISIARTVADRVGLFDDVIGSNGAHNLKGARKLQAIQDLVGPAFCYAGDSSADLPIWQAAESAVLVGASDSVAEQARKLTPVEREFKTAPPTPAVWVRAIRAHQWLKNLLLFVPLLTSFAFLDLHKVGAALLGFIAFSLTASATYLVNDLWDLDADRQHARKRLRPLASGRLRIETGVAGAAVLLLSGLTLAALIGGRFLAVTLVYLASTSAYSWSLKRYVLADVLALSLLYVLRILAGSIAIDVVTSTWLLAFSVFLFFSLALVKRCSELVSLGGQGKPRATGRDYQVNDLVVLWPLGIGAGLCSAVVFGLFVSAPEVRARYGSPDLLWLVDVGLLYWMARLWIKTSRGEMDDDPVVFAARDFGSQMTIAAMVAMVVAAYFLGSLHGV